LVPLRPGPEFSDCAWKPISVRVSMASVDLFSSCCVSLMSAFFQQPPGTVDVTTVFVQNIDRAPCSLSPQYQLMVFPLRWRHRFPCLLSVSQWTSFPAFFFGGWLRPSFFAVLSILAKHFQAWQFTRRILEVCSSVQ